MLDRPQCPNCGYYQPSGASGALVNGDRIFVNKCIYQFSPPKRWDVIVFKNPPNPQENYIKRLIALPEETVEIIDGDIYIDGRSHENLEMCRTNYGCAFIATIISRWRLPVDFRRRYRTDSKGIMRFGVSPGLMSPTAGGILRPKAMLFWFLILPSGRNIQ